MWREMAHVKYERCIGRHFFHPRDYIQSGNKEIVFIFVFCCIFLACQRWLCLMKREKSIIVWTPHLQMGGGGGGGEGGGGMESSKYWIMGRGLKKN